MTLGTVGIARRLSWMAAAGLLSIGILFYAHGQTPAPAPGAAPTAAAAPAPGAAAVDAAGSAADADAAVADEDVPTSELGRWVGRLRDAGATVPVMLFLSVLGFASIIERSVMLRRARIAPHDLLENVRDLWKKGEFDRITQIATESDSTFGRMVLFLVRHRHWPVAELTIAAGDLAGRELRRHLLRAYPLAVVGALAPLLGLLGTVSGMVDAFDAVAVAGLGDVQVLGTSISKALVTTMVGLVVAIPALFAYHLFKARTQLLGVVLEDESAELVNAWFMAQPGESDTKQPASTQPATKETSHGDAN